MRYDTHSVGMIPMQSLTGVIGCGVGAGERETFLSSTFIALAFSILIGHIFKL